MVRDTDGTLYDITPLGDESVRTSLRFVPRDGTEEEFWEWEKSNRCICRPTEWDAGLPEDAGFDPGIDGSWIADSEEDF